MPITRKAKTSYAHSRDHCEIISTGSTLGWQEAGQVSVCDQQAKAKGLSDISLFVGKAALVPLRWAQGPPIHPNLFGLGPGCHRVAGISM